MTDFTPTPEAHTKTMLAIGKAIGENKTFNAVADVAIATFLEAEELKLEGRRTGGLDYRVVGPWRKRDSD